MAPVQKKVVPPPSTEAPVSKPKAVKQQVPPPPPPTPAQDPTPAPPPPPAPADGAVVVDSDVVVSAVPPVVEMSSISILEEKLALLSSAMKDVVTQVRFVKKEHDALRRISDRVEKKRANARTTPNGFAKPTKISEELCAFLKVPAGCEKSRTEVTREIHKYIKTNSLFNTDNKRIILPDPVLKKLLSLEDGVEVTYFNLQSFLKHHFIKTPVPVPAM